MLPKRSACVLPERFGETHECFEDGRTVSRYNHGKYGSPEVAVIPGRPTPPEEREEFIKWRTGVFQGIRLRNHERMILEELKKELEESKKRNEKNEEEQNSKAAANHRAEHSDDDILQCDHSSRTV